MVVTVTITYLYIHIYIYIVQLYNIPTRVQPSQSWLSHPSPEAFPSPKYPLSRCMEHKGKSLNNGQKMKIW